jgi:hypothetical protein
MMGGSTGSRASRRASPPTRDVSETIPRVPTDAPQRGRLEPSVLAAIAAAAPVKEPPRDRGDGFEWGSAPSSGPSPSMFPAERDQTDAAARLRADPFTSVKPDSLLTFAPPADEYGLQTVGFAQSVELPSIRRDLTARPHQFEWVVGGDLAGYVADYGDRLWPIPETYRSLRRDYPGHRAYPVYVAQAHGPLYEYGYGIGGAEVSRALRVLTGGGHYAAEDYALIACGQAPAVLVGPEGALLFRVEPVPRPKSTPTATAQRSRSLTPIDTPAGRLQVEEQAPTVVAGLARVCEVFGESDLSDQYRPIAALSPAGIGANRHTFETATGGRVAIDPDDLRDVAGLATTPSEVPVYEGGTVPTAEYAERDEPVDLAWTPEARDPAEFGECGSRYGGPSAALGWRFEWESRRRRKYEAQVVRYDLRPKSDAFATDRLSVVRRTARLGVY